MQVESIVDLAKHHIELWIIKGEYEPGQKLKEGEISERLGISRPPVREAFKTLEAEGLVERRPRRGVFVSEMTEKDVREAYTLKAVLYEMAADLAIDVINPDQIDQLAGIVAAMDTCINRTPVDILQYQLHHQHFHDIIMTISGHRRLKKISVSLHNQVCRFSYQSLQSSQHLQSSLRYHREIVKAFKDGNRQTARRLMKAHVLEALEVCCQMLDSQQSSEPTKTVAASAAK